MRATILRAPLIGLTLAGALALSACETLPPAGPVTLTRFHLEPPVAPGEIAIEPRPGGDIQSLEFQSDATAIAAELTRLGFHVVTTAGSSDQVAVVDISRHARTGPPRRSPISIGIGGGFGSGGYRSGGDIGGGVAFPVGGDRQGVEIVGTQLSIQLKRRSDSSVFWEGHAFAEARADAPSGAAGASIERLTHALFAGFPGESGRTITVR